MQPNVRRVKTRITIYAAALSQVTYLGRVLSRHLSPLLSDSITPSSSIVFIISIVVSIALSHHRIRQIEPSSI
ncbi:hypothetical protein PHSY_000450 [Pseudozyma hubeiensis SY62]|uniref:Uncharacterized protein n=1 Tax=Pseudozyma hubeiensis (strain SY62) TaxID=1305764 RepID=R9NWL1_PSEHS|nr:hypothetical protein PHSY_000450 [Pseudozyma hubeiensis SY62]GAC92891.1 hypothetical protein PHSY_000450 [Pseudozyma hubeiensis SY62]